MASLAGFPPTAGFFGKLYVFLAAIEEGMYALAIIGVLTSAVGAYYYIRIVKVMYFDTPDEEFDGPISFEIKSILAVVSIFILFFILLPVPLLDGAAAATASTSRGVATCTWRI